MSTLFRTSRLAMFSAVSLAAVLWLGATESASAHGGRGRRLVVSGPAAAIPAPATTYYGGFARPSTVTRTSYQTGDEAQPAAPAATTPPAATAAPAAAATAPVAQPPVTYAPPVIVAEPYSYPMGYIAPGNLMMVRRHKPHNWNPIRFYDPYYP